MRRRVLGGLALCLTLTLTGCGGDDPVADGPTPSPSAASTSPTDPDTSTATDQASASPTTEESRTGDTYASFTATTGAELTGMISAINAPAEWGRTPLQDDSGATTLNPQDPFSNVSLTDVDASISTSTLDEQVASTAKLSPFEPGAKRLDDVVIAGNPAYHYAGNASLFTNYVDEFGFETDGRSIKIQVSTRRDEDPAAREELVGTVLASFRLTN